MDNLANQFPASTSLFHNMEGNYVEARTGYADRDVRIKVQTSSLKTETQTLKASVGNHHATGDTAMSGLDYPVGGITNQNRNKKYRQRKRARGIRAIPNDVPTTKSKKKKKNKKNNNKNVPKPQINNPSRGSVKKKWRRKLTPAQRRERRMIEDERIINKFNNASDASGDQKMGVLKNQFEANHCNNMPCQEYQTLTPRPTERKIRDERSLMSIMSGLSLGGPKYATDDSDMVL
ncbi:hypothetical protein NHQ30_002975 [Ciborinia camelliae]|nr:hypothetical protein NHQ30_002975 [Ciborinia camelliae]